MTWTSEIQFLVCDNIILIKHWIQLRAQEHSFGQWDVEIRIWLHDTKAVIFFPRNVMFQIIYVGK
jgi:hypothetical protein